MTRKILKMDGYNPILKEVKTTPVKLMTVTGDITKTTIPDDEITVGYANIPLPHQPKYIMGPNPAQPDSPICYSIKYVPTPGTRAWNDPDLVIKPEGMLEPEILPEHEQHCERCQGRRAFKGFVLDVPEGWPINGVVQCQHCYATYFVGLRRKEQQ